MLSRIKFGWTASASGYEWKQVSRSDSKRRRKETALVACTPISDGNQPETSAPEPSPVLFLELATLGVGDRKAIKAFANRYGNLIEGVSLGESPDSESGDPEPRGIPLDTWQNHIRDLFQLASLWDLVVGEDSERLGHYVLWEGISDDLSVRFESHPEGHPPLGHERVTKVIASAEQSPDRLSQFEERDVLGPALSYLQGELDLALRHTADQVAMGMGWDEETQRPILEVTCPTLRSAVWLQIADVVQNRRTLSQCPQCEKWRIVSSRMAKAHRRYCSDACRLKAYRVRQDRARQMHAVENKSFEEIAKELDSDADTVRGWITGIRSPKSQQE